MAKSKDSSHNCQTLRCGDLPPAEKVTNPTVDKGAAIKCAEKQDGGNGNPKHRTHNAWGVKTTDSPK